MMVFSTIFSTSSVILICSHKLQWDSVENNYDMAKIWDVTSDFEVSNVKEYISRAHLDFCNNTFSDGT